MTQNQPPSGPRFCRQCGATVPENTVNCPRCGQKWYMDRVEQQGVELWQKIIEKRSASGIGEAPPEQQKQYRCPNCQAILPRPANVCPHCGKSTTQARIVPQPGEEQPVGGESEAINLPDAARGLASIKGAQQRARKLHRRFKPLDIIIIVVIVLVVLGIGALLAMQYGALNTVLNLFKPAQPQPVEPAVPVISNLSISEVTTDGVSLIWNTDIEVYGKVIYGKTETYGMVKQEGNKSKAHKLSLQELEPGTSYHFVIFSVDRDDKELGRGSDSIFTTKALPPATTTPPVVSQVKVIPSDIGAYIQWASDRPCTGQVFYAKTPACDLYTPFDSKLVTSHIVKITGLEVNTPYYYRIKSIAGDGSEYVMNTPSVFNTLIAVPTGSKIGERAPDFTLPIFKSQETVSLRDFKGQKVLLTFWAVYCPECDRELELLQQIKNKNIPGVVVLAVFTESKLDDIDKTIARYKADRGDLTVPVLVDMYKTTGHMYNIDKLPCTIFIDSDRIIREIESGSFNLDQVEQTLNSL